MQRYNFILKKQIIFSKNVNFLCDGVKKVCAWCLDGVKTRGWWCFGGVSFTETGQNDISRKNSIWQFLFGKTRL